MKLKFLLIGTSLSLIPSLLYAQCTTTPDCAAMGYKETANKGGCLKCPVGNGWYCPEPQEEKAVLGECTGYAKNCKIADILNSDGTCTTDKESGKTPLGVVIYIGSDNCGYAMTASPIATNLKWSTKEVATGIGATPYWTTAITNFDACANTQKIIQQGDSSTYPAAWAAVNYSPIAAPVTKGKWCLPAPGMLNSLYTNFYAINNTISKLGGKQLTHDIPVWSSSESDYFTAWAFLPGAASCNCGVTSYVKYLNDSGSVVRPVIAF